MLYEIMQYNVIQFQPKICSKEQKTYDSVFCYAWFVLQVKVMVNLCILNKHSPFDPLNVKMHFIFVWTCWPNGDPDLQVGGVFVIYGYSCLHQAPFL